MSEILNASGVPTTFKGYLWSKIIDAMVGSGVAQGHILYRGASAWASLAPDTAGRVLRTNGAGANPSWGSAASAAGGAMTYVGSAVASGTQTTITLSGLSLDADEMYFLRFKFKNVAAGTNDFIMYYNSDTTATNYDREIVGFNGTAVGAVGANDAKFATGTPNNSFITGHIYIQKTFDGRVSATSTVDYTTNTPGLARAFQNGAHAWRTVGTNVTAIQITGSSASQIGDTSRFDVFRITI